MNFLTNRTNAVRACALAALVAAPLGATLVMAKPASAAGCPAWGSVCFYDRGGRAGYGNFLTSYEINSCNRRGYDKPITFSAGVKNRVSSVRNRTGCRITMVFNQGKRVSHGTTISPESETSTIYPDNNADGFVAW